MGLQIVKLIDPLNITHITGGLVPKGAYAAGTDYAVGDSVDYQGSSYVMFNNAGAGTAPTDTTYWQVLANKGADGADAAVSDDAYGAGWDNITDVAPSKNAVYDKIEALAGASGILEELAIAYAVAL
jgi:hypothetical protein